MACKDISKFTLVCFRNRAVNNVSASLPLVLTCGQNTLGVKLCKKQEVMDDDPLNFYDASETWFNSWAVPCISKLMLAKTLLAILPQ